MKTMSLLILSFALIMVCVRADYQVEVRFYRYWNPSHRDKDGLCCDNDGDGECGGTMDDLCDNFFRLCLSSANYPHGDCLASDAITPDDDDLNFEEGAATLHGLPNPLVFQVSGPWQQTDSQLSFSVAVYDVDQLDIIYIGEFFIDLASVGPGDSTGPLQYDSINPPAGLHVNLSLTLRCSENYYGLDCNRFCVATDSELGHYTCDENGTIVCNEGYRNTSANCTECVPAEGCSDVGGYCDGPNSCICQPFYTGSLCDIDLSDPCHSNELCQNGGTCMNTGDGEFNCTCAEGFRGQTCQFNITNVCQPDTCLNGGTCMNSGDSDYTCTCAEGFDGEICQFNVADKCQSDPCKNGGTCRNFGDGNFNCSCAEGFDGERCQINTSISDACTPNPCGNGGTCVTTTNGDFNCTCTKGFEGERCHLNVTDTCSPNPCHNGGTCASNGDGSFICRCVGGFEGESCQLTSTDECDPDPCQNGATCVLNESSGYMCVCPTGYTGVTCTDSESTEKSNTSDSSDPVLLAGGVVGIGVLVLIILALGVVLVFMLTRKQRQKVVIVSGHPAAAKGIEGQTRPVDNGEVPPVSDLPASPANNAEMSSPEELRDQPVIKADTPSSPQEHGFDNPIYGSSVYETSDDIFDLSELYDLHI